MEQLRESETFGYYVERTRELEQAAKWLRLWTVTNMLTTQMYGEGHPRLGRIRQKAAFAASRLFNILGD